MPSPSPEEWKSKTRGLPSEECVIQPCYIKLLHPTPQPRTPNPNPEPRTPGQVQEWVLKRCNNKLDPALSMIEKMPSLQDELVKMHDRFYVLAFPWKHGRTPVNQGMNDALQMLHDNLAGKFLVWNLSGEDKFDYFKFDRQVLNSPRSLGLHTPLAPGPT